MTFVGMMLCKVRVKIRVSVRGSAPWTDSRVLMTPSAWRSPVAGTIVHLNAAFYLRSRTPQILTAPQQEVHATYMRCCVLGSVDVYGVAVTDVARFGYELWRP